jgi:hypothetical protein
LQRQVPSCQVNFLDPTTQALIITSNSFAVWQMDQSTARLLGLSTEIRIAPQFMGQAWQWPDEFLVRVRLHFRQSEVSFLHALCPSRGKSGKRYRPKTSKSVLYFEPFTCEHLEVRLERPDGRPLRRPFQLMLLAHTEPMQALPKEGDQPARRLVTRALTSA